jgi:hypothetical protein
LPVRIREEVQEVPRGVGRTWMLDFVRAES